VQVIDWKDLSPKWPIMCWWADINLLTYLLMGTLNPTHSLTTFRSCLT